MTTIISISISVILAVLLLGHHRENRKLAADLKWQQAANMQLLKSEPVKDEDSSGKRLEPLTLEKIADAIRFNGFVPEKRDDSVAFRVEGGGFYVEAERLPFFFIVRGYNVNPEEWEMDLLREAAHILSDRLAMVKATLTDDGKELRFFIGAQDRNYESFRDNLLSYLGFIADGQRLMNNEYERMVKEKRENALETQPVLPPLKQNSKVLS